MDKISYCQASRHPVRPYASSALPVRLGKDGRDLRPLSFLVTVAAPREVGAQEIRMETFLPADEASETLLPEVSGG